MKNAPYPSLSLSLFRSFFPFGRSSSRPPARAKSVPLFLSSSPPPPPPTTTTTTRQTTASAAVQRPANCQSRRYTRRARIQRRFIHVFLFFSFFYSAYLFTFFFFCLAYQYSLVVVGDITRASIAVLFADDTIVPRSPGPGFTRRIQSVRKKKKEININFGFFASPAPPLPRRKSDATPTAGPCCAGVDSLVRTTP